MQRELNQTRVEFRSYTQILQNNQNINNFLILNILKSNHTPKTKPKLKQQFCCWQKRIFECCRPKIGQLLFMYYTLKFCFHGVCKVILYREMFGISELNLIWTQIGYNISYRTFSCVIRLREKCLYCTVSHSFTVQCQKGLEFKTKTLFLDKPEAVQ